MKKTFANFICCFVPIKSWRKKIRKSLTHDRLLKLEKTVGDINVHIRKSLTHDRLSKLEETVNSINTHLAGVTSNNPFAHYIQVANFGGETFKDYFINHNMPEVLANLKQGLDEKSQAVINQKLDHFLNFPLDKKYAHHFRSDTREILYTDEDREERAKFFAAQPRMIEAYKGTWVPPGVPDGRMAESFFYHHGLKFISPVVLQYLPGKSLIDIGACRGDSAVALAEYGFSQTHMFELLKSSHDIIMENLAANNLDTNKFIFHNMALSDKEGEISIDEGSAMVGTHSVNAGVNMTDDNATAYRVPVKTLDSFFSNTKEKIGMIKMDVEGEEFPIIRGAIETIRKHRPLMTITIYHKPDQFFDLKPWLEENVGGYTFMVRNLNMFTFWELETTLICIPEEALQ